MPPRVIVLLSGGLDSILAARVLQRQNLAIEGFNVRTPFDFSQEPAAVAARELGIPLTVRSVGEDYVELLRNPRYGFGKAANPCLDCRIHMARLARETMIQHGACAVASGEVLGQRPMSQKRPDLTLVARRAGLEGRLLRPLSAKRLEPTIPEREGLIDREALYDFAGRGRRELMELAEQLGVRRIPSPSPGCALTEATFAPRICDLFQYSTKATLWDCELLKVGRHFRIDPHHKVILGRSAEDNDALDRLARSNNADEATLVEPENFIGPSALVCGPTSPSLLQLTVMLMVAYTRQVDPSCREVLVCVHHKESRHVCKLAIDASQVAEVRQTHLPIA
ncbi:MAG: hypothetical protein JW719_10655 [Pirellulales bacterium]|nr:hypothetical protein [Pirellulales bacterium]